VRLALGISYDGTRWEGWQSQPSGRAVQDVVEAALSRFAGRALSTLCAGRTDAGVHALMQVVHLDTDLERDERSWVRGTNRFLPPDIALEWARETGPRFHARAHALRRRYCYVLRDAPTRPSVESGRVGWVFRPLNLENLETAAQLLVGEHDFSSFRASACQAKSPVKVMHEIRISRRGAYWRFDFEANAFLHHMIRNIMGCLIYVGQGRKAPDWVVEVLRARDRRVAAPTFSPAGLYFLGPVYEASWGLPSRTVAFDWLP
jgi:tRNA pseudouridine38-40 synthase